VPKHSMGRNIPTGGDNGWGSSLLAFRPTGPAKRGRLGLDQRYGLDPVRHDECLFRLPRRASNIWASLAEKAYAQLQAGGIVTGTSVNYGNSYSTIGNGGWPAYALEEITGASAITNFYASGSTWATYVSNSSLHLTSASSGSSTPSILTTLISDLSQGDDLILSSYTNATDSAGRQTLVADHAMSIYGYDSTTGMLEIRNPWGTAAGQYWDTTFEVSLNTLLTAGDIITADNMGANAHPQAPTVTAQTAAQTWKHGQAVNFTLASNTFTDPRGQNLT